MTKKYLLLPTTTFCTQDALPTALRESPNHPTKSRFHHVPANGVVLVLRSWLVTGPPGNSSLASMQALEISTCLNPPRVSDPFRIIQTSLEIIMLATAMNLQPSLLS